MCECLLKSFRGVTFRMCKCLSCAIFGRRKKRGEKKKEKKNLARKLRLLTNSHINFRYGKG
jgi:hypothetical protein